MHPLRKLVLLLAGADFSPKELDALLSELRRMHPGQLIDDVLTVRRRDAIQGDLPGDQPTYPRRPTDLAERVLRLLVIEGGLTRTEAAESIRQELLARRPNRHVPPLSKKNFGEWVTAVTDTASASELLHIATSIRNRQVQEVERDWRLK